MAEKKMGRPRLSSEEREERKVARRESQKNALDIQTKQALARKNLGDWGQEAVEPGDNARYLRHALTTMSLPPIDISDPQQVEDRIYWYFDHCGQCDMKPTVNGMCNALGIHRDTLHTWKTGEVRKGTHQEVVLRAYRVMEELWEDYLLNGKANPVSLIFLGKAMFGYREQQEIILTPNQQQFTPEDITTIEAKYAELPDDDY